jgi:hypothetical protein
LPAESSAVSASGSSSTAFADSVNLPSAQPSDRAHEDGHAGNIGWVSC